MYINKIFKNTTTININKIMDKIVVVYGFENEWKIYFKKDAILCKSYLKHEPFYAAPFIIEDTDINNIIKKIKEIELDENNKIPFKNINVLAWQRNTKCSWQIALYNDNLKFNVGYESEGDENGDSR